MTQKWSLEWASSAGQKPPGDIGGISPHNHRQAPGVREQGLRNPMFDRTTDRQLSTGQLTIYSRTRYLDL